MSLAAFIAAMAALAGGQPSAEAPCPSQPMPPAIDALAPLPHADSIAFAATPSLGLPRRAWVVRLSRQARGPGEIEILRLKGQHSCNRYDVENRWSAPLPAEEFDALARRLAVFAVPSRADPFSTGVEVATDGTAVELRLAGFGWQVWRQLHASGEHGEAVSSIFHALVSRHVPGRERPTQDWRARSR